MIWCVEDDAGIREIERYALNSAGFETRGFEDGLSFWEALKDEHPDLIILDVMLPGMDGIEILKRIKESVEYNDIPIILATAKGQEYDRIMGLDLGADDYIVKPFGVMEMVSRVKAVLRRSRSNAITKNDNEVIKFDNIEISLQKYELKLLGKPIDIPPKELELLYFLAKNFNRVYTRDQLLNKVWSFDYLGDSRTVDVHVKRLREKLNGVSDKWELKTVWGVGYKFEVFPQNAD